MKKIDAIDEAVKKIEVEIKQLKRLLKNISDKIEQAPDAAVLFRAKYFIQIYHKLNEEI